MKTSAAWKRAKAVSTFTKYSISAFKVLELFPTTSVNSTLHYIARRKGSGSRLVAIIANYIVPMRVSSPVRMTIAKQPPSTTSEPLKMMFFASNALVSIATTDVSIASLSPVIIDWST